MLRRIILENFMSHGRTVIDLADGLTVLTGPNNCGKSAVVAALQTVATNNSGRSKHVTRHGEKECRITIETDEGHTICWERKKSTVKYTLNGEDIHRVGSSVADSLHELLRLDQVDAETGNKGFDIHFGEQKSPVFLLNDSGGQAASFFASSSDASRLMEMQKRHRMQLADKKKEGKRLASESERNEARLESFEPVTLIEQRITQAELAHEEVQTTQQQIERLRKLVEFLECKTLDCQRLQNQCEKLSRLDQATTSPTELERVAMISDRGRSFAVRLLELQRKILNLRTQSESLLPLAEPPSLEPANACRQVVQRLRETKVVYEKVQRICGQLGKLQSPPPIKDTRLLHSLIPNLIETARQNRVTDAQLSALDHLQNPPVEIPTQRMRQLINFIQLQQVVASRAAASARCLHRVQAPVERTDNRALEKTIVGLRKSQQAVATALQSAENADQRLLECKQQVKDFVASHPKCATCGGSIDPETLMSTVPDLHEHS